jgi:hypothetical protein
MKAALKERLAGLSRGMGIQKGGLGVDSSVLLVYGNAEPERLLVRAADQFTVKRRLVEKEWMPISNEEIDDGNGLKQDESAVAMVEVEKIVHEGERKVLVTSARQLAVSPIMECEYVIMDKAAVEYLEEIYSVN